MASAMYPSGRTGIDNGTISLLGDVRVMLALSTYVYNQAHVYVADLGAVDNGRSTMLTNPTHTLGVYDADDTDLDALAALSSGALILYQHTGVDATARLIAYIDIVTGLPVTPTAGQQVNIAWGNTADRIFSL